MNKIMDRFDDITTKIFRNKRLTAEEVQFLKDLGSKVKSINLYPSFSPSSTNHIIVLNFEDRSMEIDMDYTWWHIIVAMVSFIGITKLDPESMDITNVDDVCEILLIYPEELVDFIDWCFWVYYEEIDIYGLIDKCTEYGYSETTMALLRYIHEERGEVETTMRL